MNSSLDRMESVESVLDLLQNLGPDYAWTITIVREKFADYCVFSATCESSDGTPILSFSIKQPLTSELGLVGSSRSERIVDEGDGGFDYSPSNI